MLLIVHFSMLKEIFSASFLSAEYNFQSLLCCVAFFQKGRGGASPNSIQIIGDTIFYLGKSALSQYQIFHLIK